MNICTMRVCMGSYAGERLDVLEELGFALDKTTEAYPIKEMTNGDMLGLVGRALEMGAGVMIQPPRPRKKGDRIPSTPWDYIIWVDSAEGRFRMR